MIQNENSMIKIIRDPPGGILIWILIYLELITFIIALAFFLNSFKLESANFKYQASHLSSHLATINTVILLTSGYFMAECISNLKNNNKKKATTYLWTALTLGSIFIGVKFAEYNHLLELNLGVDSGTFMAFYWSLTGFHQIHIFIGIIICITISVIHRNKLNQDVINDYESGAAFWHLCDLIWVLIFPLLYLNN